MRRNSDEPLQLVPRNDHLPHCQDVAEREVQFRYGHVWQHEYVLGSTIIWGAGCRRRPPGLPPRVVVDGWMVECDACGGDGRIALFLRDNVIWGLGPVACARTAEQRMVGGRRRLRLTDRWSP